MANLKDKIDLIQDGEQLSAEVLNRSVESLADQVDIKFSEFELDIQEGLAPAKNKLAGIADGATKNRADSLNADKSHIHAMADVTGLAEALGNKVDIVAGKDLSSNDFTNTLKDKLDGIATGAQANVNADWASSTGDSQILNKPTLGTVSSLNTGVTSEQIRTNAQAEEFFVAKVTGKDLSDENYTQEEKTKLDGIASEATKNRADSENADKVHTHTTSQIIGLAAALMSKVDKVHGKVLSDTNFTQAEKNKLASLEDSKFVGLFASESALPAIGNAGDYADVDGGVGSDVYRMIWDSSDKTWVRTQGVTGDLTPAQIKQHYESNPDTNAFTDSQETKLTGIEAGATKNRADSENANKVHTHTIAQVDGLDDALSSKASITDPRLTDAREWAEATITQEEAETGVATTRRAFTAERVRQAIVAWFNGISGALGRTILTRTTAAQVRADIGLGAVDNTSDADKPISTDVADALNDKVDKVANKQLSTEDYTSPEKAKLAGIQAGAQVNAVTSVSGRIGAVTLAKDDVGLYNVDNTSDIDKPVSTATESALSGKVDKVSGKGLSDENYTQVEKTKLAGIATGATKNATDAALRARSSHTGTQSISTITGLQTALDDRVNKVEGESLIKDTEITRLSGMETGATKNATDAALRDRTTHTGEQSISTITGLQTALDDRVNKVTGKGLSTEDYTTSEKTKLAGVATGATKNATDAQLRDRTTHTGMQPISTITGLDAALLSKVDKVKGKSLLSDTEITRLSNMATGATKNATDAQLRDRTTHTGEQAISTVTGLQGELDTKVDKVVGKGLSTEDYTTGEKSKLAGVATGATKNATDAQLRDRTTHTGEQSISTITGLDAALLGKVDKVAGKGLSSEDYTLAEKQKLASLESSKYRGVYQSLSALVAAVTGATAGDYADVDAGVGHDVLRYIYDGSDNAWIPQESNPAITASQIKDYYESNEDTNAYTDAEKTKLGTIATGATKNATDAQLRARSSHTGTQAISTISGLQSELDAKVDAVTGKGLSTNDYTTAEKSKLSSISAGATKNAADATLLARANHTGTQAIETVAGLQDELDSKVNAEVGKGLIPTSELTRLGNMATGATKNATDAYLLNRVNHTGSQTISTITGLQGELDSKVNVVEGKGLSTEDYSTADKAKLTGIEAGATKNATDAALRARSSHTGTQAISTVSGLRGELDSKVNAEVGKSLIPTTELTRLGNMETGATKNATDATLLARANHTGTQAISTITGLQAAIDDKVVKETGKGLSTNDYTTVEKTKLDGVAAGATKNSTDAYLLNRVNHTGSQAMSTITGLQGELDLKVDVIEGKGLSTNDYTTTEKNKLSGIATGATKNATDAALRARSSHTGTQAISTITGLDTALNNKVDKVAGKGLSTNDYTATEKTKLTGIAVGATKNRADSENADKVHTHTASQVTGLGTAATKNVGTSAGNLMEVGAFGLGAVAKVNYPNSSIDDVAPSGLYYATSAQGFPVSPDGHLVVMSYSNIWATQIAYDYRTGREFVRARNNGTWQPWLETVSSGNLLQSTGSSTTFPMSQNATTTALNNKVDKVAGKGLSSADFTQAEKNKLASLESSKFRGSFVSLAALQAGATSPTAGDYADVDAGVGSDATRYIYDATDARWVDVGGAHSLTAAQVKTLYESNSNTNALTDARRIIVDGATNASNLSSGTIPTARLPAAALIGDTKYTGGSGVNVSETVISADSTVVRTSGTQTIAGVKTHNDNVVMNGSGTQYKSGAEGCTVVYNATSKTLDFNFF